MGRWPFQENPCLGKQSTGRVTPIAAHDWKLGSQPEEPIQGEGKRARFPEKLMPKGQVFFCVDPWKSTHSKSTPPRKKKYWKIWVVQLSGMKDAGNLNWNGVFKQQNLILTLTLTYPFVLSTVKRIATWKPLWRRWISFFRTLKKRIEAKFGLRNWAISGDNFFREFETEIKNCPLGPGPPRKKIYPQFGIASQDFSELRTTWLGTWLGKKNH